MIASTATDNFLAWTVLHIGVPLYAAFLVALAVLAWITRKDQEP